MMDKCLLDQAALRWAERSVLIIDPHPTEFGMKFVETGDHDILRTRRGGGLALIFGL